MNKYRIVKHRRQTTLESYYYTVEKRSIIFWETLFVTGSTLNIPITFEKLEDAEKELRWYLEKEEIRRKKPTIVKEIESKF